VSECPTLVPVVCDGLIRLPGTRATIAPGRLTAVMSHGLPQSVLEEVVALLEPGWRGVVRHVSRGYRAAVQKVEAETGTASLLRPGDVCRSVDTLAWAFSEGCPWQLAHCLEVAAGR
jgi:hypothetical protein